MNGTAHVRRQHLKAFKSVFIAQKVEPQRNYYQSS
jgi:hypothetical protein